MLGQRLVAYHLVAYHFGVELGLWKKGSVQGHLNTLKLECLGNVRMFSI